MSPRAAWRLETLGFKHVYDYAPGKADWLACGFPIEGRAKEGKVLSDFMNTDVPTCRLDEKIAAVSQRLKGAGFRYCPVVNENNIVLGLFRIKSSTIDHDRTVEAAMEAGPTTFRASASVEQAAAYLSKNNLSEVLVTTSDGKLLGVVTRQMAEHAVDELGPQK